MSRFYFHLVERDIVIEDNEGSSFADGSDACADAVRQIRRMVGMEIAETGQIDLDRAIDVAGRGSAIRVAFSDAVAVTLLRGGNASVTNVVAPVHGTDQRP